MLSRFLFKLGEQSTSNKNSHTFACLCGWIMCIFDNTVHKVGEPVQQGAGFDMRAMLSGGALDL